MKKFLLPVLSLVICFTVIWKWTLGFSSFTIFTYTLNAAGEIPRTFPDIEVITQDSSVFNLKDKNKYQMVNFVYLNCPYVCHKVNNQLETIYHLIDSTVIPSKLEFVTLSFDLENDGLEKLKRYRSYFGTDIDGWSFALPNDKSQQAFDSFLHGAGIWKYAVEKTGIINHSVYLFLIAPDNTIVRVFDPVRDSDEKIAEQIKECINEQSI